MRYEYKESETLLRVREVKAKLNEQREQEGDEAFFARIKLEAEKWVAERPKNLQPHFDGFIKYTYKEPETMRRLRAIQQRVYEKSQKVGTVAFFTDPNRPPGFYPPTSTKTAPWNE